MSAAVFHCRHALVPDGWARGCNITVDSDGMIAAIDTDHMPRGAVILEGAVIPGMVNVHSHVHQRLIAGLTGYRARQRDSFWTWREQMYRAVGLLKPEDLEQVARYACMELLEGGYTVTGEFHYPHRLAGRAPADTALRLLAGADQAGMPLTVLPVWYCHSGFGRRPPAERQRPFVMGLDEIVELVGGLRERLAGTHHRVGVAPHSLRAVDVADLPALLEAIPDGPVHLHIAEQTGEVDECLEHTSTTPIKLLTEHVQLDQRWCLVHATHASAEELDLMAASDAVVGLCPTTEADLGDGLFPARDFVDLGGSYAIGSDSNLVMDAASELRLLEWGQRLDVRQRNVLCDGGEFIGRRLWQDAARAGARALDLPAGALETGRRADLVVLDGRHPLLDGLGPDHQLDTLILSGAAGLIDRVYVAGALKVQGGRHLGRQDRESALARLRQRLTDS